jgi:hypothetical protein
VSQEVVGESRLQSWPRAGHLSVTAGLQHLRSLAAQADSAKRVAMAIFLIAAPVRQSGKGDKPFPTIPRPREGHAQRLTKLVTARIMSQIFRSGDPS